jgi:nitrite reductase/ring-hydroxylating ferredoxin subunit
MQDFVRVASASDLPEGEMMLVEIGDERIVLSNLGGEFYAIGEVCTHAEGPLAEGYIEGDEVECPWHGSRFNLRTGEATAPPATEAVPRYAVRVEGGDILIGPI